MDTIKTIVRKRYYMVMTGLLCAVALFFLLSTAIQSQRLVGAQHPGFLVFNNGLVFGLVDSSWNGNRAGLRMYDFIKGYDGHPFTGTKGLIDYINQKAPDGQVQYLVTRNHQDITLAIKPMAIDQNFANLYFYIFLFCGFLTLLTGLGIFIIRPLAKGAFHFFVICNTVSIFEILFADMMTYQTFLPYLQIIIALYGIVNIHTLYFMLRMREHLHVRLSQLPVKIVLGGVYVALVAFALLVNLYSDRMFADYRVLLFASNFLFFIGGVLIYLTTAYLYFSAKSSTAKRRLLLYMALNLSCFIGFAVYVAHNVCALLLPIELILLQLAFPFLTTYLLFKYNFLDLKFTPRRKYFYLGFAVLLPMLFVVDFVFLIPILNKYQVAVSWVLPLVTASVVIKLMLLVGAAYLRIVDRLFFPSTFKFRDMITNASQNILKHHTKEEILNALRELVVGHLEIHQVYCYHIFEQIGCYQKHNITPTQETADDVYLTLPHSFSQEEMSLEGVDFVINEFVGNQNVGEDAALELLVTHKLNLLLPLKLREQVYGFVLMGHKPNFVPYTTEDLTNLQAVLATTAVALVNARHHDELICLQKQLQKENRQLREEIQNHANLPMIIGEKAGLKAVMQRIDMIGNSSISVLLHGETGTGKEVVAHAIHGRSLRSGGAFIKVNCAALPENLFESELFGHEKGSFTGAGELKRGLFEAADGGTLFLDEIGEVPLHIQPKLLRALQEKEIQRVGSTTWLPVDVRIIAATNRDLEQAVKQNQFRQDLFYRLNVLPILIPPLRERLDDIEELVTYFIQKYSVEMKKRLKPPSAEDVRKLRGYPWPGNVRELQNVIERSVALCREGERIQFFHLEQHAVSDNVIEKIFEKGDFYMQMDELKKQVIQRAITRADGNKSQAARELGLHQVSLYKMAKQLGVE